MSNPTSEDNTDSTAGSSEENAVPDDIDLGSYAVEIAFHPSKDVLAAGTEKGRVVIYSYSADEFRSNHKLMSFRHHRESCRAVQFSSSGEYLFTGSSDKTIRTIDLDTGSAVRRLAYDKGAAIYSLLSINNYILASGDDDGRLILWDFRREIPITTFKHTVEYISTLKVSSDRRTLLATSGEGCLFSYDLRAGKLDAQSKSYKDEFVTAAIVKKGTKVVACSSEGTFYIFNWGEWTEVNEKFPCEAGSIDTIIPADNDIVCAGCEDGQIRAINICPNRVLGTIGTHSDFPVGGLAITGDHKFIASCSFDSKIKFHDLSVIKTFKAEV